MDSGHDTRRLKQAALDLGFQSVGICDVAEPAHFDAYRNWLAKGFAGEMEYLKEHLELKQDPQLLLPDARSIIACALNYYQPLRHSKGETKIARYALGRDYHKVLRGKLRRLSSLIESENPEAECRACVDSAPILERDFAQQAGLGFYGKNTMLIDPKRGSWFFIGLLLTTVHFAPDKPTIGGCGSCTKCIDACPTGAIVLEDNEWQLDARKCISYLTIEKAGEIDSTLAAEIGEWTFGCDVCQEVCPFNAERESQPLRANKSNEDDFLRGRDWPKLEELAHIGEQEWDQLTRGSAVRRTGLNGLRRNARINLENLAKGSN